MSFRSTETLVVRGNEIGFMGFVPPGTMSRYGEWARWAMFRDANDAARVKLGAGVARAQHFAQTEDLRYPTTLRIETVIGRTGRTSLDMVHTFVRLDDEQAERAEHVVAVARLTLVQLGPTGPTPIDPSLEALVTAVDAPTALAFEAGPEPDAFTSSILARPSDQDQFGHVNQARYVDFADDVRVIAHAAGHAAGFAGPLGRWSVDYRREVHAGTVLRASMWLGADGTRSIRFAESETGRETTRIVIAPRM